MSFSQLALGTLSGRPRAFRRFNSGAARSALMEELNDFQPHVLHFDTIATLGLLDAAMSAERRPAIVAHTHDAVSRLYKARTIYGEAISRIDNWREYRKIASFEKRQLGQCDLILVDSPEDAAYLKGLSSTHVVETLPLGFDSTFFSPNGPKADLETPAIVFSGSFASDQSSDAGQFLVQEIMPQVWEERPGTHLYLVGSNPRPAVRALKSPRVHVTGFVEDLAAYLRAATVYACPLRLGSGMRTRVVEALACGAAVVATPMAVRGIASPEDTDPPWVSGETPTELADAIVGLLTAERAPLQAKAARFAEQNYSWDMVVARLAQIYDRAVATRKAAE